MLTSRKGRIALSVYAVVCLLARPSHALPDTSHALPDTSSFLSPPPSLPRHPKGRCSHSSPSDFARAADPLAQDTNRVDLPDGTAVGPKMGGLLGRTFEASAIPLGADVVPLDAGSGSRAEKRLLASYLPDALRFRFHFLWFLFGSLPLIAPLRAEWLDAMPLQRVIRKERFYALPC